MKKVKDVIVFAIVAILLTSCAKWKDGSPGNVWMEGKWLIFWLPLLGSLIFFFQCWRGSKSEYVHDDGKGTITKLADKTPFTKVQFFPYALGLLIASAVIFVYVSFFEN